MNTKKIQLALLALALPAVGLAAINFNNKLSQQLPTPGPTTNSPSIVTNYGVFIGSNTPPISTTNVISFLDTNHITATGFSGGGSIFDPTINATKVNGTFISTNSTGLPGFTNSTGCEICLIKIPGYQYWRWEILWTNKTQILFADSPYTFATPPLPRAWSGTFGDLVTGSTFYPTNSTTNVTVTGSTVAFFGDGSGLTDLSATQLEEDQLFFKGQEARLQSYLALLHSTNVAYVNYGPMAGMNYLTAGPGGYFNFYAGDTPQAESGDLRYFPATNLVALADLVYGRATNGTSSKFLSDYFNNNAYGNLSYYTPPSGVANFMNHVVQPAYNVFLKTRSPLAWQRYNFALSNAITCFNQNVTSHLVHAPSGSGVEAGTIAYAATSSYLTMDRYESLTKIYAMANAAGDTAATAWITNELSLISANLQSTFWDSAAGLLNYLGSGPRANEHDLLASAMAVYYGALPADKAALVCSNFALQYGTGLYYQKNAQYQFPANEETPLTNSGAFGFYWSTHFRQFEFCIEQADRNKGHAFVNDWVTDVLAHGTWDNASYSAFAPAPYQYYSWTFFEGYGYIVRLAGDDPDPEPFVSTADARLGTVTVAPVYTNGVLYGFGFPDKIQSSADPTTFAFGCTNFNTVFVTNLAGALTNTFTLWVGQAGNSTPVTSRVGIYLEPDSNSQFPSSPAWVVTNLTFNSVETGGTNLMYTTSSALAFPPNNANGSVWTAGDQVDNLTGWFLPGTNSPPVNAGLAIQGGLQLSGAVPAGSDPRINWPASAQNTNEVMLVVSNTSLYSLHTAWNSTSWGQTNKISGP